MKKKIVIISSILFVIFLFSLPFTIKVQVECRSQDGRCPEQINLKLKTQKSKVLWGTKRNVNTILKTEPMVSTFSTQFKLPNVLLVNIITKEATFAVKDKLTGKYHLISRDGQILSESQISPLPTVEQKGINPNLFSLNIVGGVYQMYQVGYGVIANDTLTVDIPGSFRVIFPLEGDIQILLGSLRLILTKLETSGNPNGYSQIDLRFANPILR